MKDWNPWWSDKKTIHELKGRARHGYDLLLRSIDIKEITIILGIRRAGKSTLMYHMIADLLGKGMPAEQILFVNLEDKILNDYQLEEIYACYRENVNPENKAYLFLDEIHKKQGWEQWIRKMYDLKTKCKFVISGSCSYLLRKEYSTLLTGRNLTFDVFPLSFKEFLEFEGLYIDRKKLSVLPEAAKHKINNAFSRYMVEGGFPEIFFKEKEYKNAVLSQYFDDILYKDIVDRFGITSQKVKDLALHLLASFTKQISLRNLRNLVGLSYDTIKDYLGYFKEAYIFFISDHFSYSFNRQKSLPSKVYCIDNGLRNAVSFKFSKDEGRLAENLVFVELKRREKEPYYWKNKNEVDFVAKNKDDSLTAINVCYGDKVEDREISGLLEFKQEFKKTKEMLILTKDIEKKEQGILFIPLWKWLLE